MCHDFLLGDQVRCLIDQEIWWKVGCEGRTDEENEKEREREREDEWTRMNDHDRYSSDVAMICR